MTLELQEPLFRWAAAQPASTGLVILFAGTVYGFYGCRFFRPLLVLSNLILGLLIGQLVSAFAGVPGYYGGAAGALVFGGVALLWTMAGTTLACGATWGLLGAYLVTQFGFPSLIALSGIVLFGGIGAVLAFLCKRTMRVVLMTLQGSMMLIVGFVTLSSQVLPSMGDTFRTLAVNYSLMVPVLLTMAVAATYACQSNILRGDIRSGARSM